MRHIRCEGSVKLRRCESSRSWRWSAGHDIQADDHDSGEAGWTASIFLSEVIVIVAFW